MKTIRPFLFLVLLPALASATSAQTGIEIEEAPSAPTGLARRVAVGMTRGELLLSAGAPDAVLDPKVWVYWEFRVREVPADDLHDALIVVFQGERIEFFKFCPSRPIRAFISRQQALAKHKVAG